MRGVHLQKIKVSRFKNIQSNNDATLPCSLAWFSLRILSLFLHGIYHNVLRTRCKYAFCEPVNRETRLIASFELISDSLSSFQLGPSLKNSEKVQTLLKTRWEARLLAWIFLKLYSFVFMGYALVSFVFLSFSRYNQVYSSVYYCGHVLFLSYPFLAPYIKRMIGQKHNRQQSHQE